MVRTVMRFAHEWVVLLKFYTGEWDVEETLAESRYWKSQGCGLKLHTWKPRQGDIETEVSP